MTGSSPAGAAWQPTHSVPPEGLQAWAVPDPSQQPTLTLSGGIRLVIVEQRGEWANVRAETGWTGWVDARRLVSTQAPDLGNGLTETLSKAWQEVTRLQDEHRTGRLNDEGLRAALLTAGIVNRHDAVWILDQDRNRWAKFDGRTITYPE
jgi:hypothetical protein